MGTANTDEKRSRGRKEKGWGERGREESKAGIRDEQIGCCVF